MWGHSIGYFFFILFFLWTNLELGGGTQEFTENRSFRSDIKYLFVKSRSFSSIRDAATYIADNELLGKLAAWVGWNISPLKASLALTQPEVILQTVNWHNYVNILSDSRVAILSDGVIHKEAALATHLLAKSRNFPNKLFIGMPENHNEGIDQPILLARKVLDFFNQAYRST